MVSPRRPYLWQQASWPALTFDRQRVGPALAHARRLQGVVERKALEIGIERDGQIARDLMADEVISTAAIQGERLDLAAVQASVMRQLGVDASGPRDRHVEGLVEVLDDAMNAFAAPLDGERLQRWQAALFPGRATDEGRVAIGRYRDHAGPMQIVTGLPGREVVSYDAPPSRRVAKEMGRFLAWFAKTTPVPGRLPPLDGLARAALAHLWFETIHPFEDGNGRVGRAIVDMAIAQDHRVPVRLYSLSRQLLESRKGYYDALNAAQRGNGDATGWVLWFAQQFALACERSSQVIDRALETYRADAATEAEAVR